MEKKICNRKKNSLFSSVSHISSFLVNVYDCHIFIWKIAGELFMYYFLGASSNCSATKYTQWNGALNLQIKHHTICILVLCIVWRFILWQWRGSDTFNSTAYHMMHIFGLFNLICLLSIILWNFINSAIKWKLLFVVLAENPKMYKI